MPKSLVKVYQPLKFEVRNVICSKDIEWYCRPTKLKMGSQDPGHAPFWVTYHL